MHTPTVFTAVFALFAVVDTAQARLNYADRPAHDRRMLKAPAVALKYRQTPPPNPPQPPTEDDIIDMACTGFTQTSYTECQLDIANSISMSTNEYCAVRYYLLVECQGTCDDSQYDFTYCAAQTLQAYDTCATTGLQVAAFINCANSILGITPIIGLASLQAQTSTGGGGASVVYTTAVTSTTSYDTGVVTSTTYSTSTNTITSCALGITNCPATSTNVPTTTSGTVTTSSLPSSTLTSILSTGTGTTAVSSSTSGSTSTMTVASVSSSSGSTTTSSVPATTSSVPFSNQTTSYIVQTSVTTYVTVTSCAPTVTNCPANSTGLVTLTSTDVVTITSCPGGCTAPTTTPATQEAVCVRRKRVRRATSEEMKAMGQQEALHGAELKG